MRRPVDLASLVAPGNRVPHVEFGSDAAFVKDDPPSLVPEPVTAAGLAGGAVSLACYLRRRMR